jgi:hypothetical protein
LSFDILDVEQAPKPEYLGAFHCIIATSCIHATRDLEASLGHARQMLRDDGAPALVEITKNMFWLDIVVGLLEWWWRLEDGREHALANEKHWERKMKSAGLTKLSWNYGATPESKQYASLPRFRLVHAKRLRRRSSHTRDGHIKGQETSTFKPTSITLPRKKCCQKKHYRRSDGNHPPSIVIR